MGALGVLGGWGAARGLLGTCGLGNGWDSCWDPASLPARTQEYARGGLQVWVFSV